MLLELIIVMFLAACVAGQLNRGIYRLAWNARRVSPWGPAPEPRASRSWLDCIPVYGWWRLRRETTYHGERFWVRPAVIEFGYIGGLGLLYAYERAGGLLPIGALPPPLFVVQSQFFNHACLISFMIVATFIDLDEKTIPDEVTVPGTLLAVCIAGLLPQVALPVWNPHADPIVIEALQMSSPGPWNLHFDQRIGLILAVVCIFAWWYALLPKTLWYRGGVRKFVRYLLASLVRHRFAPRMTLLTVAAIIGTGFVWRHGGPAWQAVLSAWVGMAVGGLTIWMVRIVAGAALGQEAMGFGDVTLMGMIGAFLGWQPALLVFFLAPFTGVLIALSQWFLTGRKDIAYGPFLCLAALLVVVGWGGVIWERWGYPASSLGLLVPVVLTVSLLLLGGVLWLVRCLKTTFR